ncbi:MAG TPA: hypothetical protein VK790_06835 [Solirubrobacteraceae bacterium]|jgi:hypothetical protein|nr:hypothetical protein [Solirubrobacteraceae bacterium]
MRSSKLALAVALAAMAAATGVALTHAPLTVAGTNSVPAEGAGAVTNGHATSCQDGGAVPRGTSAVRVSLSAIAGPSVRVRVLAGSRLIAQGERPPGWGLAAYVTVPVEVVRETVAHARVCVTVGPAAAPVELRGRPTRTAPVTDLGLQTVRLSFEYLRPSSESWWSRISSIAYHLGLGRAAGGAWLAVLVLALMLGVVALASRLTLEEPLEESP